MPIIYGSSRKYLFSISDLNQATLGKIGNLSQMTYLEAQSRAHELGGAGKPLIVVSGKFKPGANEFGLEELVYSLSEQEWKSFQETAHLLEGDDAEIHVVDGDKYATGI